MTREITVRMYNVGFGDAILVSTTYRNRPWRMLIDCGVHPHGPSDHPLDDIIDDIISEVTTNGKARIDLVVATHRHRDHVVGFENQRWDDVTVGEVWLPWTENPEDKRATELHELHAGAARMLERAFAADDAGRHLLANSLTNEKAMATLQDGFAGHPRRRYLGRQNRVHSREVPNLPGAEAWIIGPPEDESAIRAMEPPRGERWLTFHDESTDGARDRRPFVPRYVLSDAEYASRFRELLIAPDDKQRIIAATRGNGSLAAAAWLDRAINNTSLVFVLRIGGASLLFPGDAQWGVWRDVISDPKVRQLLAGVDLYKVSHHGSHNGTPRTLAESAFSPNLQSMLSVKSVDQWKSIPKAPLVNALSQGTRNLVRTDHAGSQPPARCADDGRWVEISVPA